MPSPRIYHRVLTERGFTGIAPLMREVSRHGPEGFGSALAVVQAFVTNQGNGANRTVDQLDRIVPHVPEVRDGA